MKCFVYKGSRKPDAYLYIRREGNFSQVPESLLRLMGALQLVLSFDLTADSTLAQAPVKEVLEQLRDRSFYLQLPPSDIELPARDLGH